MLPANDVPRPKIKVDLEANDAEQKRLARPIENKKSARALAVVKELESIPSPSPFQLEDLAEALAELGRWEEAAQIDSPKKSFYAEVVEAIYRDDNERCDCPEFDGITTVAKNDRETEQKRVRFSSWFTVREVISPIHGEARLMKCNKCGDLNVVK